MARTPRGDQGFKVCSFCGKSAETVEKDLERDYYMSAEEALEYGLIDKILNRSKNGENPQK